MAVNKALTGAPGKASLARLPDDRMQLRGEALTDQQCMAGKRLMTHRAQAGSPGGLGEELDAGPRGGPSEAWRGRAVHLPVSPLRQHALPK